MAVIDPSAAQAMEMASAVLMQRDRIARQRKVIWLLVAALRSSQRAQAELAELLEAVLAGE